MLDPDSTRLLRFLLHGRGVGSLATLHDGRPFASMIPFAAHLAAGRLLLVTHVSRLAAHTRDMIDSPEVCLLIMAAESPEIPPQALPRVSITALADFIAADHPDSAALKACYLTKFPHAAELFRLGDFSLVALAPVSARLIGGFARATTLSAATLSAAVAGDVVEADDA